MSGSFEPEASTAEIPWHAYIGQLFDRMQDMNAPIDPPKPSDSTTVADQYLLRAIETLGDTMNRQFYEMNSRLDKMEGRFEAVVSKGEFEAEVRRLEREHRIYESEIDKLWQARREDREHAKEVRAYDQQKAEAATQSKVVRFRWLVGIGITAATFFSAVTFGVLNSL